MAVVYQRHVIGQRDEVVKSDRSVILGRFDLANVISFVKEEHVLIAVKDDLAVFVGREDQFFYRLIVIVETEIKVRVFRENSEADALKLFIGVISVDLEYLERSHGARAFVDVAVLFFVYVRLRVSVYRDLVDDRLVSVSADLGVVRDDYRCSVGYGKRCNGRSVGVAELISAAADRIRNADSGGIGHDTDRTVIKTHVGADHVFHGHRFAVIERRLCGIEGDFVLCGTDSVAQFTGVEQFFIKSVVHDFIRAFRIMIRPQRCIDEVIFTSVCDRELFKIDSFFKFQIIVDPVVGIVLTVGVLGDGVGCDDDTVFRIRIADRSSSEG